MTFHMFAVVSLLATPIVAIVRVLLLWIMKNILILWNYKRLPWGFDMLRKILRDDRIIKQYFDKLEIYPNMIRIICWIRNWYLNTNFNKAT